MSVYSVDKLISEARRLAKEYRVATGKTLPISGEIAINDAIRLLGMQAAEAGSQGFDAIYHRQDEALRVQIKGRAIFNEKKGGHKLGQLKLEQEWDAIILVIMDDEYESRELYLARREDIEEYSNNSKSRRGSLSVARFKIIGELVWERNALVD